MGLFGRDEPPQPSQQPSRGEVDRSGQRSSSQPPGDLTVIAETITIDGTLAGSGKVLVDGQVRGAIESKGAVTVAARGRVQASVHARIVTVAGTVIGDITANDRIELEPTARVDGDITAPRILIKDGAKFKGQVNMRAPEGRGDVTTSSARKNPTT